MRHRNDDWHHRYPQTGGEHIWILFSILQSFTLNVAWSTGINNERGVAIAKALEHDATLQSFILEAWNTGINRNTEVAMAKRSKRIAPSSHHFGYMDSRPKMQIQCNWHGS